MYKQFKRVHTRTYVNTKLRNPTNQDYKFKSNLYKALVKRVGQFQVDACASRENCQAGVSEYWTADQNCLRQNWEGKLVWCNPPFNDPNQPKLIKKVLDKFLKARAANGKTSAVFILPLAKVPTEAWLKRNNMEVIELYSKGDEVFESPSGDHHGALTDIVALYGPPADSSDLTSGRVIRDEPETLSFSDVLVEVRERAAHHAGYQEDLAFVRDHAKEAEYDRGLVQKGGLLWKISNGCYQLVVPEEKDAEGKDDLIGKIIHLCHSSPGMGHMGVRKTLEKTGRRFWWGSMRPDVTAFCRACEICQKAKPSNSSPAGFLNPLSIPLRKWSVVTMDFVDGLAETVRGNSGFISFTDKLTKMVHIIPYNKKNSSSESIAALYFQQVWKLHGAPMKFVDDRYPRLAKYVWSDVMKLLGVNARMTASHNPQSDGQSENTNKTVETLLRIYMHERPKDWDLCILAIEFAINDSVHESTGFTPFQLTYGESPNSHVDLVLETLLQSGESNPAAAKMVSDLIEDIDIAKARIREAQKAQKKSADKNKKYLSFEIGEWCYLSMKDYTLPENRNMQWKMRLPRSGPWKIVDRYYSDYYYSLPEEERANEVPCAYKLEFDIEVLRFMT